MNRPLLLSVSLLVAGAAHAQLPAPTLIPRTAPRAAWSVVAGAGATTGATTTPPTANATFRCDNPGAVGLDKLWIFGGSLGNNTAYTANDLWAFDPVAGTMTQLLADGLAGSPTQRGRSAIAWNPTNGKLTVFGGNTRGGSSGTGTATLLNDTWEYDPSTNTWANVTPTTSPSPRQYASMAYDPGTGGLLMFGGEISTTAPPTYTDETWLWLGGAWAQLSPATLPTARSQHTLVTRTDAFQDVVMVAGANNTMAAPDQVRFLDVWRWTGGDWVMLSNFDVLTQTGTTFPASSVGNQAVYDPLRSRLVLQGGNGHSTLTGNLTYLYGTSYGGSPTNFTSEYDSFTNQWSIHASPTTGTTPFNNTDTVIGRVSRYFGGFIPATGTIYKACGQDPTKSGSKPTSNVYAYQANPVAAVTSYGAGCTGPGGALTLAPNGLPWTNRTWTGTCTTLGPVSLALGVWGVATASTPLNLVFPFAGSGCNLLNTADQLLGPDVPVAGAVTLALPVPNTPALAGYQLHAQVAELQFDLAFNWIGLFTSNGLTLTIGAL